MASEVEIGSESFGKDLIESSKEVAVADKAAKGILFVFASIAIVTVFLIIIFLFTLGGEFFLEVPLEDFFLDGNWSGNDGQFGAKYVILGTILVALGALAFAIPFGIGIAIFIAEIAPRRLKSILKGIMEILAGIPSIVFGYFGRTILRFWIQDIFDVNRGLCWFNASFLLGLMALPTIISVCEDALTAVPREFKEASYAMGATRWQTISKVSIPAAMSGITAGIVLGMGRAIGETMTVTMVAGGNVILPNPITDLFSGIRTITATIAYEHKEAAGIHESGLFALAIILFLMTLLINITANRILSRLRKKFTGETKKERFKDNDTIKQLKEDPGLEYVKTKFDKYKGKIFKLILIVVLFWIFSTWFGLILGLIIIILVFGGFMGLKRIKPRYEQWIAFIIMTILAIIIIFFLGIIITQVITNGIPYFTENPNFLTTPSMGSTGGLQDVILGTLSLTGVAMLFAIPFGVLSGIYLSEYAKDTRITKIIRAGIDNLNGTPSIVFGLFGYTLFVLTTGGKSLFAGGLTLGLMILPTIIRTTEEACIAIPKEFRDGSLALGSTKWQSIVKIVLPSAMPAIITGVILGMGRVSGETAPIIFTAVLYVGPSSIALFEPVKALTFHLYILVMTYPDAQIYAGGTALTLLMLVLFLYGIAFLIRFYYNRKKMW
ncbi:MAG: phosphate ABC transporter permease PstA [Candidatus Lokiarchaeota archaeon]|nr:phosphate ABC transporter permease PstA [Candidatus Lokiarchaeota archaeon]MBD3201228.1 phosphate ABC transporter permease PstA [Candidatus Lokiarchaeota archaeon]